MDISNKIHLTLKDFNKCHIVCDNDCPLGEIFDYSCALKNFVLSKMKEQEEAEKQKKEEVPQE
jgi:hypothetical protein